jgi:hypothetical protein
MSMNRHAVLAALVTGCLSKPSFVCRLVPCSSQPDMQLGFGGPDSRGVALCDKGLAVGIGFTISSGINPTYMEKTAVRAFLVCAPISTNGVSSTTELNDKVVVSQTGGTASSDGPFFEYCPDGQVVIGLAAYVVGGDHLFNSLAIDCSAIDQFGVLNGEPTRVALTMTGTRETDSAIRCSNGKVLLGLESWTGTELDRLQLHCGGVACSSADCEPVAPAALSSR